MIFNETRFKGVFIIEPKMIEDKRGFFARSFCHNEFAKFGIKKNLIQCSISFNKKAGTLRGIHYQVNPYEEAKVVRCTKGAIYDVIIDLRIDSSTYGQWLSVELSVDNYKQLYVPEGFAHGFQTLEDNTEIFYQMFEYYHPESGRGIRWNDPLFNIVWPEAVRIISDKDKIYADFKL